MTPVGGTPRVVTAQALGGDSYRAAFPTLSCGLTVNYGVFVQTTDGNYEDPAGEQAAIVASGTQNVVDDACESLGAWLIGGLGDTATSGQWINADPVATAAQPEDDHTVNGVNCWITGTGVVGGGVGAADIDGGQTTLTSPVFNATVVDTPYISYWRWYSNNAGAAPNEDSMPVEISNNCASTWVSLEVVSENAGAWVQKNFRIADVVPPTSSMRIRFRARDLLSGSVVEAGVDDVKLYGYDCTAPRPADVNATARLTALTWGSCSATGATPGRATSTATARSMVRIWVPSSPTGVDVVLSAMMLWMDRMVSGIRRSPYTRSHADHAACVDGSCLFVDRVWPPLEPVGLC
ncbi:MAG: hypothetical protein ACKPEA_01300 [Planctomycetota bacterium]